MPVARYRRTAHGHVAVPAPPARAPRPLANQCKGSTPRVLRERFPWPERRPPSLWSRASFAGVAGTMSAAATRRSFEQQGGA